MIWLIVEILLPIIVAGVVGLGFGFWVAARMCDRRVQDRDAQIARLKLERDNAAANRPQSSGTVSMPVSRGRGNEPSVSGPRAGDSGRAEPSLGDGAGGGNAASAKGSQPPAIDRPRDGTPDDLQKINGIGPKIEKTLNRLGIYHYDQIAAWNEDQVAWIDGKLKFRGRVEREGWIEQAKDLAAEGSPPEPPRAEA